MKLHRNWREVLSWKKDILQRIAVTEDNWREIREKTGDIYGIGDVIYLNNKNKLHRLDGPAVEKPDGTKGWYINGNFIMSSDGGFTQENFETYKKLHNITSSLRLGRIAGKESSRIYTIQGPEDQLDQFEKILNYISRCCVIGHSIVIKINVDGGGATSLSIKKKGGDLLEFENVKELDQEGSFDTYIAD
jgi:hypothetical protein